jgi:hypothetical protein
LIAALIVLILDPRFDPSILISILALILALIPGPLADTVPRA